MGSYPQVWVCGFPPQLLSQLEQCLTKYGIEPRSVQWEVPLFDEAPSDLIRRSVVVGFISSPPQGERIRKLIGSGAFVVAVCHGLGLEKRLELYREGVVDLVDAGVPIRELAVRIKFLTDQFRHGLPPAGSRELRGSLREMGLQDVVSLLQMAEKTGVIALRSGEAEGFVFIRRGQVVDVLLPGKDPQRALTRMALWTSGQWSVRLTEFERPERLAGEKSVFPAELERLRRFILAMGNELPNTTTPLVALEQPDEPSDLDDDERTILRLLDGKRTLLDLFEETKLDPEYVCEIVRGLKSRGMIGEVERSPATKRVEKGAEQRVLDLLPLLFGIKTKDQGRAGVTTAGYRKSGSYQPPFSRTELRRIAGSVSRLSREPGTRGSSENPAGT